MTSVPDVKVDVCTLLQDKSLHFLLVGQMPRVLINFRALLLERTCCQLISIFMLACCAFPMGVLTAVKHELKFSYTISVDPFQEVLSGTASLI